MESRFFTRERLFHVINYIYCYVPLHILLYSITYIAIQRHNYCYSSLDAEASAFLFIRKEQFNFFIFGYPLYLPACFI